MDYNLPFIFITFLSHEKCEYKKKRIPEKGQ